MRRAIQGGSSNRIRAGFDPAGPVEGAPQSAYRPTGPIRSADSAPTHAVSLFADDTVPLGSPFAVCERARAAPCREPRERDQRRPHRRIRAGGRLTRLRSRRARPGLERREPPSGNAPNLFDQRYSTSGFYPGDAVEGFRRSVFGTLTDRW